MPEYGFTVDTIDMPPEVSADQSGRDGFQVVDQLAQLNRRVRLKKQMDMIFFAVKLDQFGTPFFKSLPKDRIQPLDHAFVNCFASVFSN